MIEAAEAEMLIRSKLNEVRIAFQMSLAKLGNNDTRDIVSDLSRRRLTSCIC